MSDETPIEIINLSNGLTLELYDRSKPIVGDRWTVILVARVEVEVTNAEAAATLGASVTYEQERERVFVDDGDKSAVFGELRASLLASQQAYVARADFAERFVRRQLALASPA